MPDSGEEFTGTMKSIGSDLFSLFKTIVQERQRREREAKAQQAQAAKEQRAEETAAQIRKEEREFMKAENEKMRTEMRDILKANGMDVSDKNLAKTQEVMDKMDENQTKMDDNLSTISANESTIGANQTKIDANKTAIGKLDGQISSLGADPQHKGTVDQFKAMKGELEKMNTELDKANTQLAKANVDLKKANADLEVDNVLLSSGKGLDQLQDDPAVRNDLAKQIDHTNQGITRDQNALDKANGRLSEIDTAQNELLNAEKPDMGKWEELQAEKVDMQKQQQRAQDRLTKKQDQLQGLKAGNSVEQLEKLNKQETALKGGIQQANLKIEGNDKIIKGYKSSLDSIKEQQQKDLREGRPVDFAKYDEVRGKIKDLEAQKELAQKEVAKLETELDGVQKQKMEAPKEGPKLESQQVEGPKEGPKLQSPQVSEQSVGDGAPQVGGKPMKFPKGSVGDTMDKNKETTEYVKNQRLGNGQTRQRSLSVGSGMKT